MKYYYEAFTAKGAPRQGSVEADSESEAAGIIRKRSLLARDISSSPIDLQYDYSREPEQEQGKKTVSKKTEVSMRLNPDDDIKEAPGRPLEPTPNDELQKRIENIARVARVMTAWEEKYKKLDKDDKLPTGCPDVGGGFWKCFEDNKSNIISNMIQKAMEDSV